MMSHLHHSRMADGPFSCTSWKRINCNERLHANLVVEVQQVGAVSPLGQDHWILLLSFQTARLWNFSRLWGDVLQKGGQVSHQTGFSLSRHLSSCLLFPVHNATEQTDSWICLWTDRGVIKTINSFATNSFCNNKTRL